MNKSYNTTVQPCEAEAAGTAAQNLSLLHPISSQSDSWAGFIQQLTLKAMPAYKLQWFRSKYGCHLSALARGGQQGGQLAEGRVTAFSHLSLIYHWVADFRGRDV